MPTNLPASYSHVSLEIKHAIMTRSSFITYVVQTPSAGETPSVTAGAVLGAWNATSSMKARLDSNATLVAIHVRVGSSTSDTSGDVIPVNSVGTNGIASLPPNCAVLVKKKTGLAGRKGRGRFFMPHMVAATNVDEAGTILAAEVITLQTAFDNWMAAHVTAARFMYLFHPDRQAGGASPPGTIIPGGPPTLIENLQVSALIGSQRRRLGR